MSHYQCTKCICFAYVNKEINYKPSLNAGHRRGIAFLRSQGAKLGGACNSLPSNLWNEMHQISKLKCFLSRLEVVFAESIEDGCYVEDEYVVGAAPTDDVPITSEWSTIFIAY